MPRTAPKSNAPKRTPKQKVPHTVPSLHLYRKVVVSFVIITALLIVLILYFSFVSATISVVPQPQTVNTTTTISVVGDSDGQLADDQLPGAFFDRQVTGQQQFEATGSVAADSDTVGRVTIVNNYRRPQPLVATTRLLADDGTLLRIVDRVDVPVGQSAEVAVYADDPAQLEGKTIAAGTRFSIPGLWVPLQEDIYAEAVSDIALGQSRLPAVAESDITTAEQKLLEQLEAQVLSELGVDSKVAHAVTMAPIEQTASAAVGDQVEQFSLEVTATAEGVFFDREALIRTMERQLRNSLPDDQQLLDVNYDQLTYDIVAIDVANQTATVEASLSGQSVIRLNSEAFAKDRLKGLTEAEVYQHFAEVAGVESVRVRFFPFWVNRVPQLLDHIDIRVTGTDS